VDRKLHDISESAGPVFQKYFAARGLAVGDYDNDGALDVLIGNNGGAPVLLKNNAAKGTMAGPQTGRRTLTGCHRRAHSMESGR